MGKTHSIIDTYSYKCAAGLKTLLVEHLLMQNRHMTGEEKNPKTRDEWRKVNGTHLSLISIRDDTQLVSARGAEGTNEQHGTLRKSERSRIDGIQFPRTTAV